jgi:hypothetical protein
MQLLSCANLFNFVERFNNAGLVICSEKLRNGFETQYQQDNFALTIAADTGQVAKARAV